MTMRAHVCLMLAVPTFSANTPAPVMYARICSDGAWPANLVPTLVVSEQGSAGPSLPGAGTPPAFDKSDTGPDRFKA